MHVCSYGVTCESKLHEFITFLEYCELKYTQGASADKLKRDLTSKCGEDRRRMLKDMVGAL